jgi:hypothetical protein
VIFVWVGWSSGQKASVAVFAIQQAKLTPPEASEPKPLKGAEK